MANYIQNYQEISTPILWVCCSLWPSLQTELTHINDRLTESFKLLAGLKAEISLMDEGADISPQLPGSIDSMDRCATSKVH